MKAMAPTAAADHSSTPANPMSIGGGPMSAAIVSLVAPAEISRLAVGQSSA
jgi:hypothetical protein